MLWIADYNNNRVIGGIVTNATGARLCQNTSTTSSTPSISPFNLTCDPTNRIPDLCLVQNPLFLTYSILRFNYSVLFINSSFTVDNHSVITLTDDQNIRVSGNVTLAGTLKILLSSNTASQLSSGIPVETTLINFNGSTSGYFSSIQISELQDSGSCGGETITPQYKTHSLSAIISLTQCIGGETKSVLSAGAIAGIVVGTFCAVFLCIVLLAGGTVLVVYLFKKKHVSVARF